MSVRCRILNIIINVKVDSTMKIYDFVDLPFVPECRNVQSSIYLLLKSETLSLKSSSVAAQPVLCRTWSETP